MNGNNHPVEDSWDVSITSPRPHLETQALLLLLLLYVSLWSVSMGVVIAVANIEVQDPPPVLYLCCFTKFSFRQYSAHFLSFKTGFFSRLFLSMAKKRRKPHVWRTNNVNLLRWLHLKDKGDRDASLSPVIILSCC